MNCKPGDLAITVCSTNNNQGKIVTVGRWLGKVRGWVGDDRWEINVELPGRLGGSGAHYRDSYMRPITPPPGSVTESEVTALYNPTKETA